MDTNLWGLRCETARGSRWIVTQPMTELAAKAVAAQHKPHPAGVIKAAPLPAHLIEALRDSSAMPLAA